MQFVAIESTVKSTFIWSKMVRIVLGFVLIALSVSHFYRAWGEDVWWYLSLGCSSLVGGIVVILYYWRSPYLKIHEEGLSFKLNVKEEEHTIHWRILSGMHFESRAVRFQLNDGEWPVHFNCSNENFDAIKKVLRHCANERGIGVKEQEYI